MMMVVVAVMIQDGAVLGRTIHTFDCRGQGRGSSVSLRTAWAT